MPDKKSIAVIGYSGHSLVVIDAAKELKWNVKYYCEKNEVEQNPLNLIYLGDEASNHFDWDASSQFILGIGDNRIRKKIAQLILSKQKEILTVQHPTSVVSQLSNLGVGNFVAANAIVNAFATVEDFCILNTGCIIEHECRIKTGAHIAPGAVLAGNVTVGEQSFIGANAVVKQGVTIGDNVVVGAGSVVLQDILDNEIWVGNPAKKIK